MTDRPRGTARDPRATRSPDSAVPLVDTYSATVPWTIRTWRRFPWSIRTRRRWNLIPLVRVVHWLETERCGGSTSWSVGSGGVFSGHGSGSTDGTGDRRVQHGFPRCTVHITIGLGLEEQRARHGGNKYPARGESSQALASYEEPARTRVRSHTRSFLHCRMRRRLPSAGTHPDPPPHPCSSSSPGVHASRPSSTSLFYRSNRTGVPKSAWLRGVQAVRNFTRGTVSGITA